MYEIRIIVAGSRTFEDYGMVASVIAGYIKRGKTQIVSGGAKGADMLGEQFAEENDLPVIRMDADWDTYGKAAGPIRNRQMAEYATHLIAFWDGKSRGTWNMITEAVKHDLNVVVLNMSYHKSKKFNDPKFLSK